MRTGIDAITGQVLTGWAHCSQSIATIVSTAIGARVLKRDLGADAPALLDRPQTPAQIMTHYVAIAEALRTWEPGYRLRKVAVQRLGADGVAGFQLWGDYYPRGHLGDYSQVVRMQTLEVPA